MRDFYTLLHDTAKDLAPDELIAAFKNNRAWGLGREIQERGNPPVRPTY